MARKLDLNNLKYYVMEHVYMDGNSLINKLNDEANILHHKKLFLFNGKPYSSVDKYDSVIDGTPMVLFRWSTNGAKRQPMIVAHYGYDQFRAMSNGIPLEDITGYDIVDVWDGNYYVGTFKRITTWTKEDN